MYQVKLYVLAHVAKEMLCVNTDRRTDGHG